MSDPASSPAITFHVRATVLWREPCWHCECGYASSHWFANLYHDDVMVAEWVADGLTDILRIAEHWHSAVKSRDAGAKVTTILQPTLDRRDGRPARRAVTRNGRRATDPSPKWRR